jgi:membrane-bound ClpP family serine protease
MSSSSTLPTFSPLFNVPQTSSVNSNFFAAALQQQIASANSVPGGIAAGQHQQPFATALQQQIAQIHQHQQQQQHQAAAMAAAQAAAVNQNPFMTLALNTPGGLAAHQNQFFAAAAAAQGQHHLHGHPGGLLFLPRLP